MERTYFKNTVHVIYKRIDELMSSGDLHEKNIVLFGLNTSSFVMKDYLKDKGFAIAAYVDNSEEKRNRWKESIPAYAPEQLQDVFGAEVIVLIISKYYHEMKEQLLQLGYDEQQVIQIVDVKNTEQYVDYADVQGMREIGVEELKAIQMKLLRELDRICSQYNLRYFLCGGSLIGAVRHQGYIPWDDDVDVVMPMQDYRKLLRIVNDSDCPYKIMNVFDYPEKFNGFLGRMTYPNTNMKDWTYPYIESVPINIDIFPLFGLPDGNEEEYADEMLSLHTNMVEEFIKYPEITQRYYDLQKQILERMERYPFDESEKIAYLFSRHKKKEIMSRHIYDSCIRVPFETETFPIPVGYDAYLRILFGDSYMELPPEKDRVSVHNYRAFVEE